MAGRVRMSAGSGFDVPSLDAWNWRIAAGMAAAWVAELVLTAVGVPLYGWLGWSSPGWGAAPWTLLTWPLVQGGQVLSVVIGLYVVGSVLPAVFGGYSYRKIAEAVGWMLAGGVAVGLALSVVGGLLGLPTGHGFVLGWLPLTAGLFTLFGLRNAEGQVYLFFALPIDARAIVWVSLGLPVLMWLAGLSRGATLGPAVSIGAWAGAYLWFHQRSHRSPRRDALREKGRRIERELQVLQGGRSNDTFH